MEKMTKIEYILRLNSEWHISSGLGSGSDKDNLVLKDKNTGLPIIPGRGIRGLIKDAYTQLFNSEEAILVFGGENNDGKAIVDNASIPESIPKDLVKFLFRTFHNQAMNEDGITESKSLRNIEVVIPITLRGEVIIEDEEKKQNVIDSMKFIKKLGSKRLRGLGRCDFFVNETQIG